VTTLARDRFCCPHVDSPSVFAHVLDAERCGFYLIAPGRALVPRRAAGVV
jgi:hypothetical protein